VEGSNYPLDFYKTNNTESQAIYSTQQFIIASE